MSLVIQIENILVDINCHCQYGYPLDFSMLSQILKLIDAEISKDWPKRNVFLFRHLSNKIYSSFQNNEIEASQVDDMKDMFMLFKSDYYGIGEIKNEIDDHIPILSKQNYLSELIRIHEYLSIFLCKAESTLLYLINFDIALNSIENLEGMLEYYYHYFALRVEDYKELPNLHLNDTDDNFVNCILRRKGRIEALIEEIEVINKEIFKHQHDLEIKYLKDDSDYEDESWDDYDMRNVADPEGEFWREYYHGDIERLGF